MRFILILIIFITTFAFAGPMKKIGKIGKISEVTRTITVKMYDSYYKPAEINVKKGETIKFIVLNVGELVHEFNLSLIHI